MSGHVHWEDPKPMTADGEKPLLVRRASTLVTMVLWPGIILLILALFFYQSIIWWLAGAWMVTLGVAFLVRGNVVARYKANKLLEATKLQKAENTRMPLGQTTAYGAGIAYAADDARIRAREIAPLADSTQAAVDNLNATAKSEQTAAEYQRKAEEFARKAKAIRATGLVDRAARERCARLWLDAAESFRLAGDHVNARHAGMRASEVNPHVTREEAKPPPPK